MHFVSRAQAAQPGCWHTAKRQKALVSSHPPNVRGLMIYAGRTVSPACSRGKSADRMTTWRYTSVTRSRPCRLQGALPQVATAFPFFRIEGGACRNPNDAG